MHIPDNPSYRELKAFIDEHKREKGVLIKVLYKAQDIFGYLPKEVQAFIAKELNLKLSNVFGVATFYNFFRLSPVGKYVINVCLGTACHVKGAEDIVKAICEELKIKIGETTEDGLFTLSTARCFGSCGLAPCMMINEEVYGRLNPQGVIQILKEVREKKND